MRSKVRVNISYDEKSESDMLASIREPITSKASVRYLCVHDPGPSVFINHNVWPGHKEYWEEV